MTDKAETAIGDEVSEDRRRLSYQTGFGDFCFDSARMREKRYESVRGNFQIMKLKSRASPSSKLSQVGVSSREGNGDVTSPNPSSFLMLPQTIRERIYWWVGMSYNCDNAGMFELRLQRIVFRGPDRLHYLYWTTFSSHPSRPSGFLVTIFLKKNHTDNTRRPSNSQSIIRQKREESVRTIRHLSNTCAQIRHEQGALLWRRVCLELDDACHDQFVDLMRFRPAICAGIKSLRFTISLYDSPTHKTEDLSRFSRFCGSLKLLRLDSLRVGLYLQEKDLPNVSDCENDAHFGFLTELKEVRVTSIFEIYGRIELQRRYSTGDVLQRDIAEATLQAMWFPRIEEILMPNTLRPTTPRGEEEEYLQARKALVSIQSS